MSRITLRINRARYDAEVDSDQSLLSVLRDVLDLTGTKFGCAQNECAACTVLLDGRPEKSCRLSADACVGREVTTIEGLETNGRLHPVQQAFLDKQAMQCGFCTPGMIMASVGLLRSNTNPTPADIIRYLQSNICRCGTYPRIVAAVQDAAARMRGGA